MSGVPWTKRTLQMLGVAALIWGSTAAAATVTAKSPIPVPSSLRTSYDRLSDQSIVAMRSYFTFKNEGRMSGYSDVQLAAFFTSPGDSVSAPDSVTFLVIHGVEIRVGVAAEQADWWFAESGSHELRMLSDDIRHDLGPMLYFRGSRAISYLEERRFQGPPNFSDTVEILAITLKAEIVQDLFSARATEGIVDGFRFFVHNKAGGAHKLYREFAAFLRDLDAAAR